MTFDIKRYMGKWYEQGSSPEWFSKGCKDTTAEYSLRGDGTVSVRNTCTKPKGVDVAEGSAYPTNAEKKLKVGFFPSFYPLFRGNYDIVYLDEEYENAVVRSGEKGWILTRDDRITDERYERLLSIAKKNGIKGIVKTSGD